MKAPITLIPLMLLSALLTAAHSAQATPTGSLPAFCELASPTNEWTGAVSTMWENGANWSTGLYPGNPTDFPAVIQDVCIPAGTPNSPVIGGGDEEHLRTLDVESGATVSVEQGGKLFLYGSQTGNQDSVVRQGGRLDVNGATLGGIAKLHVLGTLVLQTNSQSASTTVLTRECSYFPGAVNPYPGEDTTCGSPVEGPRFRLEVDDTGAVHFRSLVAGNGVNLGDETTVVNRGLLRVRSSAYVAADHGVRVFLRPHRTSAPGTGTLRFDGNGGLLEGKIEADTGIAPLATLENRGLVLKAGGLGRTLVSAAYTQPSPGKVSVRSGTLLLPSGPVTPAFVSSGATYGTGRCAVNDDPSCTPTTLNKAGFRQSASLRVPSTSDSGANVLVRQLSSKSTSSDLGLPYVVHATSLTASLANLAVIRLRFDSSIANGRTASTIRIYRKASSSQPYRYVKACTSTDRPPSGESTCVDRDASAAASSGQGGDVVAVIRTRTTSRWVGR